MNSRISICSPCSSAVFSGRSAFFAEERSVGYDRRFRCRPASFWCRESSSCVRIVSAVTVSSMSCASGRRPPARGRMKRCKARQVCTKAAGPPTPTFGGATRRVARVRSATSPSTNLPKKSRYRRLHWLRNRSGAFRGTLSGVADLGSGLNLAKTPGLSRKCFCSVWILVPFAG